jgi:hypothetical protein
MAPLAEQHVPHAHRTAYARACAADTVPIPGDVQRAHGLPKQAG